MILYCPEPSVIADRTFSISAGLDASTVTPGSTAPDASLTVPAMELVFWACAARGSNTAPATPAIIRTNVRMRSYLQCREPPQTVRFLDGQQDDSDITNSKQQ